MKFIQVGVSGFGSGWVKRLAGGKQTKLIGLVDVSEPALAKAREMTGLPESACFRTLKEAIAAVKPDAVVCVTPPEYHRACAVEAMRGGLDVISEKPMAASMSDCRAMLKASRETGRTCVISQNYRYSPAPWTMADLVRRNKIGQIGQVNVDFHMGIDFHGGFRHEMAYPLLVDMSIHHFDLIRFITGLNPVSVSGSAWNPPWSNYKGDCSSSIVFEMENGARVAYSASWCSKGQFCDWNGNWRIEGSKGAISYQRGDITLHSVPALYKVESSEPVTLKEPPKRGQDFVLADFMKAVKTKKRPRTDVFDNIYSIAMVFAAVQAVRTGRKVAVAGDALKNLAGDCK